MTAGDREEHPPPFEFSALRTRLVPLAEGYDRWLTVPFERRVLVVVRTTTTLNRLIDVLTLFENDHRVQVVFTLDEQKPALLGAGVPERLERLGGTVIPWRQATEVRFDLALAASENDDLHLLDAPVVLLPHGIGFQKYYPGSAVVAGMNPDRLVRNGAVVPELIAVTHTDQIDDLWALAPDAAAQARVVGDPCLDRMLAGRHRSPEYRTALGADCRKLVTIASTWGPDSLLGTFPTLPLRMVSTLPYDEFAVCLVTHPGITAAHGGWQLDAWLAQATAAGLRVIPPDAGWQAAITAADCVVTDAGSVALYAAGLGRPLLLADGRPATIVAGSPAAALAAAAPRLDPDLDLAAQLRPVISAPPTYGAVISRAVDDPGRSAGLLRTALYELMKLPEPLEEAEFTSHPAPAAQLVFVPAFVIGAQPAAASSAVSDAAPDTIALTRFPLTRAEHRMDHQHIAAHATRASLRQLSAASIVFTELAGPDVAAFTRWATRILRGWPDAEIAAARVPGCCLTQTRDGVVRILEPQDPTLDPMVAASLLYLGRTGPVEIITIGDRSIATLLRTV